jgi:hypothetical protein
MFCGRHPRFRGPFPTSQCSLDERCGGSQASRLLDRLSDMKAFKQELKASMASQPPPPPVGPPGMGESRNMMFMQR